MAFSLPTLPYPKDSLAPHMSQETLEFHHDKHHRSYVEKLNQLIEGTRFTQITLEEIILNSEGEIFNNAAQHFNHTFFWNGLTPKSTMPYGEASDLIHKKWGDFQRFKEAFKKEALEQFGSGWTWLVRNPGGNLEIMSTSNADTPAKHGLRALLTLDVWEHAYYIDYRNARKDYIDAFWNVVNWEFVNRNLASS